MDIKRYQRLEKYIEGEAALTSTSKAIMARILMSIEADTVRLDLSGPSLKGLELEQVQAALAEAQRKNLISSFSINTQSQILEMTLS